MKLFVWRDVLTDYSSGLAVALAEDVTQARGMLTATGDFRNPSDLAKDPEEHPVDEPFVAYVHGGG